MFWESILFGAKSFLDIHVLFSCLVVTMISSGFTLLCGYIISREERGSSVIGIVSYFLGGTAVHALLASFLVFYLFPIMLGGTSPVSTALLLDQWKFVLIVGGIAVALNFLLTCIPIVGNFIDNVPGAGSFVEGIIIFRIITANVFDKDLYKKFTKLDIFPGLWDSVGYFCVSLLVMYVFLMLTAYVSSLLTKKSPEGLGVVALVVAPASVRMLGLLPLFMYAQYVALKMATL